MSPGVSEPWMIQTAWNTVETHIHYLLSTEMQCALDSSHMGCGYKNTQVSVLELWSLCKQASIHKPHCDTFKLIPQHTHHILPYFNTVAYFWAMLLIHLDARCKNKSRFCEHFRLVFPSSWLSDDLINSSHWAIEALCTSNEGHRATAWAVSGFCVWCLLSNSPPLFSFYQ